MLYKEPVWNKAYRKAVDNGVAIAVPIHFQLKSIIRTGERTGVDFDKLNYLLITKTKAGNLIANWVTLYPTNDWIKGNRKTYLGKITVRDWDGNLKKAFSFDGAKTFSYKPIDRRLDGLDILQASQFFYTSKSFGTVNIATASSINKLMGEKYQDINGDCWENIREVQSDNSSGPGVTLYRKKIDCAELEPKTTPTSTEPHETQSVEMAVVELEVGAQVVITHQQIA